MSDTKLDPIDRQTIDCWRVNYGLDKTPHELHAYWSAWAPPGAVLALKAAVGEIERLRAGPWIGKCQACGHEHEAPNAVLTGAAK